jgi:hypothetical protein
VGDKSIIDDLIDETRELDARASKVQGQRDLIATSDEINELVDTYQRWFVRALSVLPEELHDKFRDLYEGGFVVKRIRAFLEAPGKASGLFDPDQPNGLIPYWENPYETTFHSSLLEQRQLLLMAKQLTKEHAAAAELRLVQQIGRGLPALVDALQHRHAGRPAFDVSDEYDVQDVVHGVLAMLFEDVRPEDPSPTRAGGSSRVDFLLKRQQIIVEIKMTRAGMRDRDVGNQLIEDIERYRSHPDCKALVAIVYDPGRFVRNPRGLEEDLSGVRDELLVSTVVVQG